jgi:hypothetical protein
MTSNETDHGLIEAARKLGGHRTGKAILALFGTIDFDQSFDRGRKRRAEQR